MYWCRHADVITASLAEWLRRPPREREIRVQIPLATGFFRGRVIFGVESKFDTPVATLPCRYRVSAGTGWPGVVTGKGRKFDLQLVSQCGSTSNCLSRSVPEIH